MADEKFLVTLEIDGRSYPVRIKKSEEEAYRKAAKTIKDKMNQYRVKFGASAGINSQDIMAMTTIQALVENFSLGDKNYTKPFEDKIHSLIGELDDYLKKQ